MGLYRKKPVVIEAVQWTGDNHDEINGFVNHAGGEPIAWWVQPDDLKIGTLEGTHDARIGDWIIRGVKGEFYPCKPDIFEQTYEPAEEVA